MIEELLVETWGWRIYTNQNDNKIFAIKYFNRQWHASVTERLVIGSRNATKKQQYGINKNIKLLNTRKINLNKINISKYTNENEDKFRCADNEIAPPFCVFYTQDHTKFSRVLKVFF